MKKVLIALIGLLAIASCCGMTEEEYRNARHQHDQQAYQEGSRIYTITGENEDGITETHEFIFISNSQYINGIDHWPGCKYCKNKKVIY